MNGRARTVPTRAMTKPDRQRLVGSLIARKRIGTQLELLRALEAAGVRVTQATVSRDIRELGLEKREDELGRPRYVLPATEARPAPRDALERIVADFGRRATAAQNVVVLQSELGAAPAIARALDRTEHPKVVGTLAGDDTVLVIARNGQDARSLARELGAMVR